MRDPATKTAEYRTKPKLIATLAWIFYDFADTAYSMNVVTLYFGTWIILHLSQSDAIVSFANSFSMILVALTMPVLGDWSDHRGRKLLPLLFFSGTCIAGTAVLGILGRQISNPSLLVAGAIIIFIIANYSYQGALVFYNALLPAVSTPRTLGRVSGYGVAIGYMGAILGLLVAGLFVDGEFYGLRIPGVEAGGASAAFIPTALVYLVFALPIFIFVKEPVTSIGQSTKWCIKDSYRRVYNTALDSKKYPGLGRFLIAKLLYEDSIQTVIIFMAIYTQSVVGFTLAETNKFFIVVIPSAIIGSAFCGIMSDHYGPKKTLTAVIILWFVILCAVVSTNNRMLFWIFACLIGALMGSTWTSARPLLITLAPREKLGEFFGLYALSGKLAAVIGPLMWSTVTYSLASFGDHVKYKAAILTLAFNMLIGALILWRVPDLHKKSKTTQ